MTTIPVSSSGLSQSTVTTGILFMLASIFAYSCLDALAKWTVTIYAPAQFLLIRSTTSIAVLLPFVARNNFAALKNIPRPGLQFVRVALSITEVILFFSAVYYLPLADTITCYLASPIFVVAMSALFLGEKVGWRRWLAVTFGFIGVLIAMKPSTSSISWGALVAVAGAFVSALLMIVTRQLRGTSEAFLAFGQIVGTLIFGAAVAPFVWITPEWPHVGIFLVSGIVSVVALLCINRSLRLAPASVLAPFKFTAIFWAASFGYFAFGDVPSLTTAIGAAFIISAGLYIFLRERKLARLEATMRPPPA
jgi:drug/metabolite transporter (DMT)-like permease